MSSLRENLHVLRRDGQDPRPIGAWTMQLVRAKDDGSVALGLELREEPRPHVLWTWSKVLDPQLDEISQILDLMIAALLELDDALSVYRGRIRNVRANKGFVPQREVTQLLEDEVKRAQGGQSIPDRNDAFHERVRIALADVDRLRIETTRVFFATQHP